MPFIRLWREKINARPALLITGALLVAAFIISWLFLVLFLTRIEALKVQKRQLAADVGALNAFADSGAESEKIRQQLLADNAAWQLKLPDQVQTAEVLRQLDAQALLAGVQLAAVKPQAPRVNENLTEVPFEVTAYGDFFAACRFLQQLRAQAAPAMRVVGFTLSVEQTGGLKQVYVLATPGLTPLSQIKSDSHRSADDARRGVTP